VDPRIAADDDAATGLGAERGAQRAHHRIIEIAIGDAADVVFTEDPRVHGS
jgi:hypothetical protein